jgi:hypothetical protein
MFLLTKENKVIFHFQKNEDVFYFQILWSSSIFKKICHIPFSNNCGRLPFSKEIEDIFHLKIRLSSIFHILGLKVRLHSENQLPKLSRAALIKMIPGFGVVWRFFY